MFSISFQVFVNSGKLNRQRIDFERGKYYRRLFLTNYMLFIAFDYRKFLA